VTLPQSALSHCRSNWLCVDHHYRPSAVVQVREDEVAAVVAVVGRMAAVEVAVEAQAEQSLADIVNSHSPLWVQMPRGRPGHHERS
jgi:hypothetical protein